MELDHIISYCKQENKMQLRVYGPKVQNGTMNKHIANRNFLIIRELGELAADMKESNIGWKQLREEIEKKKGKQNDQLNLEL